MGGTAWSVGRNNLYVTKATVSKKQAGSRLWVLHHTGKGGTKVWTCVQGDSGYKGDSEPPKCSAAPPGNTELGKAASSA